MGSWILLSVLFAVAAWALGGIWGAEASRARHEQDCLRKLGYDPVAVPWGGLSGPIDTGDEIVLYPYCPERRLLVSVGEKAMPVVGCHSEVWRVVVTAGPREGDALFVSESTIRDHGARFKGVAA